MNCTQSHDLLQQRLDGLAPADQAALDRHLADCGECRRLHAAAARLEEGLRLLSPPLPPPGLAARIAARATADRRRRLLTVRVPALLGAAAVLFVAVLLGSDRSKSSGDNWVLDQARRAWDYLSWGRSGPSAPSLEVVVDRSGPPEIPEEATAGSAPSLRATVAEAGSAMASLTSRAADEALGQTRLLLPETIPASPLTTSEPVQPILEPPTESLRQAGSGMSAALDPVTSSARRAVSLFFREASSVVPEQ